jgi:ribosome-binding protein aMBF1 (putative translation factor)
MKTKTEALQNINTRPERITLAEARDMIYEKFRTNCRLLRAKRGWSGVEAGEKIGLKNGKRMIDLEYGRANPTIDELLLITKCFCVSMDNLMHKEANIIFE